MSRPSGGGRPLNHAVNSSPGLTIHPTKCSVVQVYIEGCTCMGLCMHVIFVAAYIVTPWSYNVSHFHPYIFQHFVFTLVLLVILLHITLLSSSPVLLHEIWTDIYKGSLKNVSGCIQG